jgi:FkbM family methyltransferase
MAYPKVLSRIVKKLLASKGLTLTGLNPGRPTMDNACRAIASRGHSLSTVIDIGASDGRWSLDFMRYYPDSQYLLIEAQPVHEPMLKVFCNEHPKSQYVLAAAGESSGEIFFDSALPLGGQASYTPFAEHNLVVPVITVDVEVETRRLPGPYLIKLDTHGFEVPILRGARRTLEATEIIIMECYNYHIAPECLLFDEMCASLRGLGFQCIDLADPMFRPHDDTLWQMDLVFVHKNWPGLSYTEYD